MTKLGELGEVNRGRSRHRPRDASHLYGGPYPFIQTGDIKSSGGRITSFTQTYSEDGLAQSRLWPAQTMCITIAANIAETALLSFPACFPDSVVGFIADENKCDVRFIEYVFRRLRQRIQSEATGSVQDNINLQTLARLSFAIPPLCEQVAIADALGAFDDRINLLRQTNTTLEAIAQALFKSWFVDFDPVHSKAEGREPEAMDAATAALFPSEFEASELRPIPKGWRVRKLADSLSLQIGGAWGEEHESAKSTVSVSCLRGIDAVDIGAGTKPSVPIRWVSQRQIANRTLTEGDILVEGSGSFCGRSLYWISSYSELVPLTPIYSNFVKRLRSPLGSEVAYWASLHLAQVFKSGEISNYRTGSAFPNLDVNGLLGKKVSVPSDETIFHVFFDIARPLLDEKKNNIVTSVVLAELRDTLLPRLISGKLSLPEAMEIAEAALA